MRVSSQAIQRRIKTRKERCWQAHKTNGSALLRSNCCFDSFGNKQHSLDAVS